MQGRILVLFAVFRAACSSGGLPPAVSAFCQDRLLALVSSSFPQGDPQSRPTLFTLGVKLPKAHSHQAFRAVGDLAEALVKETPYAVLVGGDPLSADLEGLLRHYRWKIPFLFVRTAPVDALQYARILEAGYHRVVEASDDLVALSREAGAEATERWATYRTLALKFAQHGVAVVSPQMLETCALATRAGASQSNVLLLGATGVGKERMARTLHDTHPEGALRPYVVVNSATLVPAIADSLLFGHEKGAFTGANGRTEGHFREAHGGTLVFDEVQNMPLEVQAKLLRVLQEGQARAVGGREDYRVNVRVIAISNRPLREMVEKGEFREDLFHRLGQLILEIPPLKDRPEDLVLQARFFLALFQPDKPSVDDLEPIVIEALRQFRWPGNSRQLENVIQEALLRHAGKGATLPFEALPPWFRRALIDQQSR